MVGYCFVVVDDIGVDYIGCVGFIRLYWLVMCVRVMLLLMFIFLNRCVLCVLMVLVLRFRCLVMFFWCRFWVSSRVIFSLCGDSVLNGEWLFFMFESVRFWVMLLFR